MTLTREDFDAWRHNPLTELVLDRVLQHEMNKTKAAHDAAAWEGPLPPEAHMSLRERHDTLAWLRSLDFETVEDRLREEKDSQ
jgi:hypothetical protein